METFSEKYFLKINTNIIFIKYFMLNKTNT
jgi:hypothetical protein